MINVGRGLYTFSNRTPLDGLRFDTPHRPDNKPLPTRRDTSAKQLIFKPKLLQNRTANDMTRVAWPTNNASATPDGKFGPARQIKGWGDCWFLAALAAVANDEDGRRILAESIKQVTVEGIRGYTVTFKGSPNHPVFISEQTLAHFVDENGGDADTRLIELAADRFFSVTGRFRSLYLAALVSMEMDQKQAEQCFNQLCRTNGIQDPNNYNPIRTGIYDAVAFFMFTGIFPEILLADPTHTLQPADIMAYLNLFAPNDRNGNSMTLTGIEHPLGNTIDDIRLVYRWDVIRTEITSNGTVDAQEQVFLNALDRWLETPDDSTWQALQSAAGNLTLQHISLADFVALLHKSQIALRPNHRARLRSGVQEVLGGGRGHIGFPGTHSETIEGINEAQNTFTYSDPNYPTVVHTGELSSLIQAIANGHILLTAQKPTTGQEDEAESSHAGEQRGRHLLAFHHQAVRDKTIDRAESGPLANLMDMDEGTFRHVFDGDHNGVIEGGELKAVQLQVDRWVKHLTLTPIW